MLMPASWSAVATDREIPKRNEPSTTHSGLPRASIAITIAMKPWPCVMNGVNVPAPTVERYAPPSPASAPVQSAA